MSATSPTYALTDDALRRMHNAAVFLDEPGCSTVRQLIEEVQRQRAEIARLNAGAAKERTP